MKTILLILTIALAGCGGYIVPSVGVSYTPGYYGGYRPYSYRPYYYRPLYRPYYRGYHYRQYRHYSRWH